VQRNHAVVAIWIAIVAAVWVTFSKYIGIPDSWPGFIVSCLVMIEGPKWQNWAKAQLSVLVGLGCAITLVPWVTAWVPALGMDLTIFLVIAIYVAVLIFVSENIPKILNASMVFVSFSANYGALEALLGPKAHPGEMFWAWLVGGAFMSLAIIYGLLALQKMKVLPAAHGAGSDTVAG